MNPNTDPRLAIDALERAIKAQPDDFAHPGYEQLAAFVDGRLDDADREVVETHVEMCEVCLQDVTDLSEVRDSMRARATSPTRPDGSMLRRILQIAAVIMAIVGAARFLLPRISSGVPKGAEVSESQPAQAPSQASAPAPASVPPADALTADERALVDRVLASGALEMPAAVRELAAPIGTLLGMAPPKGTLAPVAPIGTAVLTDRPAFTWTPIAGATSYTLAVYDERFNEVARSEAVTGTSWTPSRALPRGATLAWQVTAHLPSRDVLAPTPPQPEARFQVVNAATADQVVAERARLANEPLALGILSANAGLLDDAAAALKRASAEPATAERAKALLVKLKR